MNAQLTENHSGHSDKECSEDGKLVHDKNGYKKNNLSVNDHGRNGRVKNGYSKNGFVKNGSVICAGDVGKMSGREQNGIVQTNGTNGFVYRNDVAGVILRNGLNGLSKYAPCKNGSILKECTSTPDAAENMTVKRRKPHCEDQVLYSKKDQSAHSSVVAHGNSIKVIITF